MNILLPSFINDKLFSIDKNLSWRDVYELYERAGIDRNPLVKHLPEQGLKVRQLWVNHEYAQKDWAKEHGVTYSEDNWYLDILSAQIDHYNPELIYNTTLNAIPYSLIHEKKNKNKKCTWICYYGVPRTGEFKEFREYTFYLTGFRALEKDLKRENKKYYFFPHYFDDGLVPTNNEMIRDVNFSFIGSLCYRYDFHGFNRRRRLVETLMDDVNLQAWSHLPEDSNYSKKALQMHAQSLRYELYHFLNGLCPPLHQLSKIPFIRKVKNWEIRPQSDFFFNPRLSSKVQSPLYGKAMYDMLSRSQLTLNVHGKVDADQGRAEFAAGNIRLFEATGAGACLLTDALPGLEEFFEPGSEIVTYDNAQDAAEKARFLISNPKEREAIAQRGRKRARAEHTSSIRAKQFADILKENV